MDKQNDTRRWFGTMLDCSRNAVLTVESVKEWIDISADLGYNMLMLYTEDTYEVKGHPYFGYCRGRYSVCTLKGNGTDSEYPDTGTLKCHYEMAGICFTD